MADKIDIPSPPPTVPAHALAIDRLTASVENMRAEMAAQGALSNRERTTVLDHLARFDHALKTVVHDLQQVKSTVINAVERLERVEAVVFQKLRITATKPERRHRASKKR